MFMRDGEHFHVSGIAWPVSSPELTVPDLVCGCLKASIHRNCPHTIQEVKCDIWDEIATTNQELLRRIVDDFVSRLRQRGVNQGGHLQDITHQM